MDAEASPSRSISTHLRGTLNACRCREPVHGEGVCATCRAKLSFIAPPYCVSPASIFDFCNSICP
jgi:hypothetical protein